MSWEQSSAYWSELGCGWPWSSDTESFPHWKRISQLTARYRLRQEVVKSQTLATSTSGGKSYLESLVERVPTLFDYSKEMDWIRPCRNTVGHCSSDFAAVELWNPYIYIHIYALFGIDEALLKYSVISLLSSNNNTHSIFLNSSSVCTVYDINESKCLW